MTSVSAPLLGRKAETSTVLTVARSVVQRGAAIVSLVGEAGAGKSAVLEDVVASLESAGFRTMRVALSEVEAHLGWAGMRLLCRDVTEAELDALPEGLGGAIGAATGRSNPSGIDPSSAAFALAGIIERRAAAGPVLLVVDDLHWLDLPTAGALAFAIRATARAAVLSLVAHRPVSMSIEPNRLLPADHTHIVDLPGLSVASTHALLRDRLGVSLGRPDVLRVHGATGGHPLHTIEIGRLLASGASLDEALVHPSAYALITKRIEALPSETRRALLAAAIAPQPLLERVRAALDGRDVQTDLAPAVRQQLVDIRRGTVVFSHPLDRSAVIASAPLGDRRELQRALAATAADPDERVALRMAAAEGADAELAFDLDEAVERAEDRGDLQRALELARRAVELTPPEAVTDRIERLLTAANLASAAGDLSQPVQLAEAAEALTDDIEVHFRAGVLKVLAIANSGDEERPGELMDELLPRLADHPAKRARLHDLRAQLLLRSDIVGAEAVARAAVEAAMETGDESTIVRERALWTWIRVLAGRPTDLDEVERIAATLPVDSVAVDWLGEALHLCGRSSAALELGRVQLDHYRRRGLVHFEAPVRSRLLGDLISLGRYDEALEQAEAWFELQTMIHGVSAAASRADVAYVHGLRGDVERAERGMTTAEAESTVPLDLIDVFNKACLLYAVLERWGDAADRAVRARSIAARVGLGAIGVAPFRSAAVEALVNLGRLEEAREYADELAAMAAANREPRGAAEVARAEAVLAAALGDPAGAANQWRTAVEQYTAVGLPLERGRAELGLGSTLRRMGKRAEATQWLTEARHTFGSLGIPLLVARTDAEIQRLGTQRGGNPNDLTPTEQQVVDLVVAGRSNAEIAAALVVSLRTVESNLTRVYRKVGVRSRTELSAAYRRSAD